MSESAYFEYALVLPEERYLIEVQTRNPAQVMVCGRRRGLLRHVIPEFHERRSRNRGEVES
jgi:hypothetical protein